MKASGLYHLKRIWIRWDNTLEHDLGRLGIYLQDAQVAPIDSDFSTWRTSDDKEVRTWRHSDGSFTTEQHELA